MSRGAVRGIGVALAVTVVATAASLCRLWLANPESLTQSLWAEDGLFPLCIRKAGIFECTVDPFAGYLILVPRLAAVPTSLMPIEQWAMSAVLVSALSWGFVCGLLAAHLVRGGLGISLSVVLSMLPVLIPLVGLEATTSVASIYMPMMYALSLAIVLGPRDGRAAVGLAVAGFLVSATIPLTILLLPVLLFLTVKKAMSPRSALVIGGGIAVGLIAQSAVIATAEDRRNLRPSLEAVGFWLTDLPTAMTTLWPGFGFGEFTAFGFFSMPAFAGTGLVLALVLLSTALVLALRENRRCQAGGLLILLGLGSSLIPTITGYASNRYFVVTVLCVAAAALLILFSGSEAQRSVLRLGVAAAVLISWSVALPSSEWRATPSPVWGVEVARLKMLCIDDPTAPVTVTFSPDWPQAGITELSPPTNAISRCDVFR